LPNPKGKRNVRPAEVTKNERGNREGERERERETAKKKNEANTTNVGKFILTVLFC